MNIRLLLLIGLIIFSSCKEDSDIYKTTSGAYASKTGKFVAKFPTKPKSSVIDNKIGFDEFKIFLYISTLGPNKIFSVEHYDYPEGTMNDISNEKFLEQSVANYVLRMSGNFELDFKEQIVKDNLKGISFVLHPKDTKKNKGMILGEIFKKGNRVYVITFLGVSNNKVGEFMDSFRILN